MSQYFGKNHVDAAKKCFVEDRELFGNIQEKEKYNLYNGLANLASAVEEMQADLDYIKRMLTALANRP